jgi:hypothetical protein
MRVASLAAERHSVFSSRSFQFSRMAVAEGVALGGRPRTHRDMTFVWQTVRCVLVMCVFGVAVDRAHTVKAAKLDPMGRGAQYSAKMPGGLSCRRRL